MKRILQIILITGVVLFGNDLAAQTFKGEVIGGLNMSHIMGDDLNGYRRPGLNAGIGVLTQLTNKLSFSVETLYSMKGAQEKGYSDQVVTLSYLEAPMLLHYELDPNIFGGIGFSYGQMIGDKYTGTNIYPKYIRKEPYNTGDFNFLADVRFPVYEKLKFNFRFATSLLPIREVEFFDRDGIQKVIGQKNYTISFRLIYVINEKEGKKKRERIEDYQ